MTMVALLMRPWIMLMRANNAMPRCLADDLLILCVGPSHGHRYVNAMQLSRDFFKDMGSRIADTKCFSFSSAVWTRTRLRYKKWDRGKAIILSLIHI